MKVMTIANTNIDELVEVQNEQVVTDSLKVGNIIRPRDFSTKPPTRTEASNIPCT